MRDRLYAYTLTEQGAGADGVFAVLNWVCDPMVADAAITNQIVEPDDEPQLWLPEEILEAFVDAFDAATDKARVQRYLGGLTPEALTELGAAARRLDRMCKFEVKQRGPSCDTK